MIYQIILLYILKHSWESSLNKVLYKKILKPKNVFGDLKKLSLILPFWCLFMPFNFSPCVLFLRGGGVTQEDILGLAISLIFDQFSKM